MVDKKLVAGTFTLMGTMIGAGILALPYAFSKAGFLAGLFWLIILGIIMLFVHLYLGEVILRTNGFHQLTGYAEKYLGNAGKKLMIFAMIFGVYSALIAYLIGEGQSFSFLFFGSEKYVLAFGILFWFCMTLFLRGGMKGLKKVASWGVFAVVCIIIGLFVWFAPQIETSNLYKFNTNLFFLPFGIVLFALLGFTSIPEVGKIMQYSKKNLKMALILGSIIPIIIYLLFTLTFVGVLGENIKEVATLSLQKPIAFLGIFTMLTAYFVLSFSLKDMLAIDLRMRKKKVFILVSVTPLVLFLLISYFKFLDFGSVLSLGGIVSGAITGILILLMNYRAKKWSEREPEYWMPLNWLIILIFSLIFILGGIFEFFF